MNERPEPRRTRGWLISAAGLLLGISAIVGVASTSTPSAPKAPDASVEAGGRDGILTTFSGIRW